MEKKVDLAAQNRLDYELPSFLFISSPASRIYNPARIKGIYPNIIDDHPPNCIYKTGGR